MDQRLSIITLGVRDIAEARRFFEDGLGWKRAAFDSDAIAFYATGGTVLALFGSAALAEDAGLAVDDPALDDGAFSRISIAWNGDSKAAVDEAFTTAVTAGAEAVKAPVEAFWGGYSGYVRIPGGHLMELAYNPFFPLGPDGSVTLPPPGDD